jgi:hypothetical protein
MIMEADRTISLSVKDRLRLQSVLMQARASLADLRLVRGFLDEIGFTEQEHQALCFETTESGGCQSVKWQDDAVPPRDFQVGPALFAVIQRHLTEFGKRPGLDLGWLPLFDLFEIDKGA